MSDSMCYLLGDPPSTVASYRALALQTACHSVNRLDVAGARRSIRESIARVGAQVRASKQFIGTDLQLVVLPEYFATSYPLGETIPGWAEKAGFDPDGEEYDLLSKVAQDNQVYLASNAYERDPHFPGLYFQASVVLSPSGEQVLRYRRLISLFAPSPHDVWDAYLDHYGEDAVFPVARTAIGNLACVASEEILYPEIARALALRGAEVLLHSTSEVSSPDLTPKDIAKRARAIECMAYVVSANTSEILGVDIPGASTDGMSKIVDDSGRVLAVGTASAEGGSAPTPETVAAPHRGTDWPTATAVPGAGDAITGAGAAVPTWIVVWAVSDAPAVSVTRTRTVRVPTES